MRRFCGVKYQGQIIGAVEVPGPLTGEPLEVPSDNLTSSQGRLVHVCCSAAVPPVHPVHFVGKKKKENLSFTP